MDNNSSDGDAAPNAASINPLAACYRVRLSRFSLNHCSGSLQLFAIGGEGFLVPNPMIAL